MIQRLKPVVELNSDEWPALLKKYKLEGVMSAAHVQLLWQRVQHAIEPDIWYTVQIPEFREEAVPFSDTQTGNAGGRSTGLEAEKDRGADKAMTVLAAATLGEGMDTLLEAWSGKGQILDSYTADCLAMEALQCVYSLLEDELLKQNLYITEYCFPEPETGGSSGDNGMAAILQRLQCGEHISLTEEGTLRPLKSVVFSGILTHDGEKRCSTICANCSRTDCPNRHSLHMGNYREPGALKYSYGYQRIFGRS